MPYLDLYDNESRIIREGKSNGILVDSNVLLIYLVNLYDAKNGTQYRYKTYEHRFVDATHDYLVSLVGNDVKLFITPHILTETWHLIRSKLKGVSGKLYQFVVDVLKTFQEYYVRHTDILSDPHLIRFGVADIACARVKELHDCKIIITTEDDLGRHCCHEKDYVHISKDQIYAWYLQRRIQ